MAKTKVKQQEKWIRLYLYEVVQAQEGVICTLLCEKYDGEKVTVHIIKLPLVSGVNGQQKHLLITDKFKILEEQTEQTKLMFSEDDLILKAEL